MSKDEISLSLSLRCWISPASQCHSWTWLVRWLWVPSARPVCRTICLSSAGLTAGSAHFYLTHLKCFCPVSPPKTSAVTLSGLCKFDTYTEKHTCCVFMTVQFWGFVLCVTAWTASVRVMTSCPPIHKPTFMWTSSKASSRSTPLKVSTHKCQSLISRT